MIEENLVEIVNAIENLNLNPDNSFGTSLADQVYELTYEVKRIADVLEQIYTKNILYQMNMISPRYYRKFI
jgi:hypothetical protein